MATHAMAGATLSKLAFCDLLLDSAVELERAQENRSTSAAPLEKLANALLRASKPFDASVQTAFVEPTFYDSFERLFRMQKSDNPESVEQLQAYLAETVEQLRSLEKGKSDKKTVAKMIDFCVGLHQELTREIEAEDGVVVDEWRTSDVSVEESVG